MAAFVAWGRVVFVGPDGTAVGSWLVGGPGGPGLDAVDALARMQVHARRLGGRVRLVEVSPDLAELLELVGLGGEVGGEAEGGEQPLGVEEGVVGGDPLP
jgi:hypothetical protein